MKKWLLLISITPMLTGCVGTWISGHTGRLCDDYPDIRKVPEREEACTSRGLHGEDEVASRAEDFKCLELDREQLKARDEAIREGAFPEAEPVE